MKRTDKAYAFQINEIEGKDLTGQYLKFLVGKKYVACNLSLGGIASIESVVQNLRSLCDTIEANYE